MADTQSELVNKAMMTRDRRREGIALIGSDAQVREAFIRAETRR